MICQWFSLVTSSLVKIIGKSPHSWPKIVIHGNSCIILYVSNSAPITHCSKRSQDPAWHKGHNRTDIAQFGRFQQSLGSLWHNYIVKLPPWTKTLLLLGLNRQDCPHCACHATACYHVARALAELGFLSFLFVFNWTQWIWKVARCFRAPNSLQTHVIFTISKDKYTSLITDSMNCRNCTFSRRADSGSRSTSEIWMGARCFEALNRDYWTQMYDILPISRKVIWSNS